MLEMLSSMKPHGFIDDTLPSNVDWRKHCKTGHEGNSIRQFFFFEMIPCLFSFVFFIWLFSVHINEKI